MRLTALTSTLTLLLTTSTVFADTLATPTPSTTPDDYRAEITPFPQPQLVEDDAHLEIRQQLGAVPDAEQAVGQMPPITIYSIATQVGATGVQTIVTYTQLFSPVPDQWPSASPGTIGYGTLQHKREVEARDTGVERVVEVEQPVVMVREMEVVTVPLQRVLGVLVVEGVVVSNTTAIDNGMRPAEARNGSSPALLGTAAFGPLYTAAAAASGFA